nr:unnamed protein product [Callosobruchus analis]
MDLNNILDDYKENEVLVCNNFSEITFDHSEQCSISIMHVNIRSIYQNFDQFLAFLGTAHELFDVIVMSETHFIHNTNDFGIPGYVNFFNESKLNKCDGCAIYVKNNWFVSYHVLVENTLRINKILLEKNGKQVEVLATYRGFGETKETFINNLNNILEKESSGHNKIQIFTGDINIDLLSLEEETTNNYLSLMQRHGFVSIINKPTRKTNNTKSCLDHFFVKCKNSDFQNIRGTILECGLTDHDAILLHIATKKHIIVNKKYTYKSTNNNKLKELIEAAEWDDVLANNNVNMCTDIFINKLKTIITNSTITKNITCKKKRLKPWISAGLLVSIRNRDHLKKESTLNPNNLILLQKYRDYRKMLSKLIKKTKYAYYKAQTLINAKDKKKIWKLIKEATNDQVAAAEIREILDSDKKVLTGKKEIANEFNNYFSNIGKRLANNIGRAGIQLFRGQRSKVNLFFLTPVTELELSREIQSLKEGVKGGDDCISSSIVKQYKDFLKKPLLHIVNKIFVTVVFPETLKKAIVIPWYKQGDRKSTCNYRPIALTSTISKIVEKCLRSKILAYLEKKNC